MRFLFYQITDIFCSGPSKHKDAFSALLKLQPGTHHLQFLVDGEMKLSSHLPTAVDFAGCLVNYIEVLPESAQPPASAPVDIPSGTKQPPDQAQPQREEYRVPAGLHPPQVLPPTPELIAVHKPPTPVPEKSKDAKPVKIAPGPEKKYHTEIPKFLLDLDAPEDSPRLACASAVVNTLPAPPSLPLFLGKSILNGATPMKDDNSVLVMPNHTVLNHLATSSIRYKVLATSATTRYKKKVRQCFFGLI
jgi:5'-AMP-activated protein kinase beta subunit, interaction domain/Glycogen recognition site of AMP-activated protein kinase